MSKNISTLLSHCVIQSHPDDYKGYPFLTLIQYQNKHSIIIMDNITRKVLKGYVLDLCNCESVNEEQIISVAYTWHQQGSKLPISIEFLRQSLFTDVSKIYRSFAIDKISRIMGPIYTFNMDEVTHTRRRKRKPIPGIVLRESSNCEEI